MTCLNIGLDFTIGPPLKYHFSFYETRKFIRAPD